MQSGITASPALHSAFTTFTSTPTSFALLITISTKSETLEPLDTIPSPAPTTTSSDAFYTSLPLLQPYLLPTRPLYLVLRRHPPTTTDPPFIITTYIPTPSPVLLKTLFASTRLTVPRALGAEKFQAGGAGRLVTEAAELESGEWEAWERSEEGEGQAPLTEGERVALAVRKGEEQELRQGRFGGGGGGGTGERRFIGGKGMKLAVGEAVMGVLGGLGGLGGGRGGGENLVMLRIDSDTETIELAGTAKTDAAGLAGQISDTEPRYSFWRFADEGEGEGEGRASPPVVFIYTCPEVSNRKAKLIYASSKLVFLEAAKEEARLNIVKRLEASSPSEITAETIEDEFRPKQEQKQAFARPKRPGKR